MEGTVPVLPLATPALGEMMMCYLFRDAKVRSIVVPAAAGASSIEIITPFTSYKTTVITPS